MSMRKCKQVNLITIGNAGVGKTSLIKRFCQRRFVSKYSPTVGIDYGVIKLPIRNNNVKINIFDMAGDQNYYEVRNEFYGDSAGALLVFDLGSYNDFKALENWLAELYSEIEAAANYRIVVVGNKVDVAPRAVTYYEASKWCAIRDLPYFETSALTGHGVSEAITNLVEVLIEPEEEEGNGTSPPNKKASKKGCKNEEEYNQVNVEKITPENEREVARTQKHGTEKWRVTGRNKAGFTQNQLYAVNRIRNAANHYERLNISSDASKEEINKAYRKLASVVHPDKNFAPGSEEAFKLLVAARMALIQSDYGRSVIRDQKNT